MAVAEHSRTARTALWTRPIERPQSERDLLAVTSNAVAFLSGGRLCAFTARSGKRLWCRASKSQPVAAGETIGFIAPDGAAYLVDADTGRHERPLRIEVVKSGAEEVLYSTGRSFLLGIDYPQPVTSTTNFGEIDTQGRVLWTSHIDSLSGFVDSIVSYPYYIRASLRGGATLTGLAQVYRLGYNGGLVATIPHAAEVLDVINGELVFRGDQSATAAEPYAYFEVGTADLATGALVSYRTYRPDAREIFQLVSQGRLQPGSSVGRLALDDRFVYFGIATRTYRYSRLTEPASQHPLLISDAGRFVAGPFHGEILVSRGDGVWALHADDRAVQARRIISSRAELRAVASVDGLVAIAFADGTLRAMDIRDWSTVLHAKACPASRLSLHRKQVIIVCADPVWTVSAFAAGP
jgi:hypothetical protein